MNQASFEASGSNSQSPGPVLTKSDDLTQIPMLWKIYAGLQIKKRQSQVEKWIKEKVRDMKAQREGVAWRKDTILTGYVALHDAFSSEKGIPSSCEVLTDMILDRGTIPHINTFVNIYNVISAMTGVSIGAHDTERISGNPRLEIMKADAVFAPIGGGPDSVARRGEYAYVDDMGVICRMDIKQCDRTKITERSCRALVIFQGHEGLSVEKLRQSIHGFDEALKTLHVQA